MNSLESLCVKMILEYDPRMPYQVVSNHMNRWNNVCPFSYDLYWTPIHVRRIREGLPPAFNTINWEETVLDYMNYALSEQIDILLHLSSSGIWRLSSGEDFTQKTLREYLSSTREHKKYNREKSMRTLFGFAKKKNTQMTRRIFLSAEES